MCTLIYFFTDYSDQQEYMTQGLKKNLQDGKKEEIITDGEID